MKFRPMEIGAVLLVASLWLGGLVGCGGGPTPEERIAANNDTNIKRLASLYAMFQLKNQYRGPANEAEFKTFIQDQDADRLKLAGIDVSDVDGLFISERDEQPFKIRYGLNTRVRGPSLAVIFEQTGVDGQRQVGFTGSAMQEVDSDEYDRLWNGELDNEPVDDGRGQ